MRLILSGLNGTGADNQNPNLYTLGCSKYAGYYSLGGLSNSGETGFFYTDSLTAGNYKYLGTYGDIDTCDNLCLGFVFKTITTASNNNKMKKVTGIGGIFFKCKHPKAIDAWYKTHLGFDTSPYGTSFEWRQIEDSTKKGLTQWNPFQKTKIF